MIAVDSQSARCSMAPSTANSEALAAAAGSGPGIRPAYVAWAPVGVVMPAILAAAIADVYGRPALRAASDACRRSQCCTGALFLAAASVAPEGRGAAWHA